ncbi:DUF418 domain-containing protein [Bacillus thuringiensis]|uniref:DUF418 domain-containing protein n=1 Tax=Bacillus thuringiensis TaxID=1428 RepID=A0AAW9GRX3_BACTU|nr:DUF418 domain-containing protein [Bacillus thuringiensis]MDY0854356.1 DUF418 domain-containing protein [Bacillus thuringiensis]MDY4393654.1 DUF418 domain-containing protein [Bacillus thuringiensis]
MNKTISPNKRIVSLDIIRGFALLGILFINIPTYQVILEGTVIPSYSALDKAIENFISIFIEKKFFSIFSFLFGVGFYIFTSRAESRGDNSRWRFTRRLLSLFVISIVHVLFFFGTILYAYAIIGFLLLPFYNASHLTICKWLVGMPITYLTALLVNLVLSNKSPILSITNFITSDSTLIFIMFLAGFFVARTDWIIRIKDFQNQIRRVQLVTLPLFIGSSIWIWTTAQSNNKQFDLIIKIGVIPTTIFYLCTLFLLLENKTISKILTPVAYVGRMALTNYVAQSFIGLAIMSFMSIEYPLPTQVILIAALVFVIQTLYTIIWFKFFKMGPVEKVWRFMTYGRSKKQRNKSSS